MIFRSGWSAGDSVCTISIPCLEREAWRWSFWLATTPPHRPCTIKVLCPELRGRNANSTKLFLAEARTAASLVHPRIVAVQNVGELESRHFIEMEYATQQTDIDTVGISYFYVLTGGTPLRSRFDFAIVAVGSASKTSACGDALGLMDVRFGRLSLLLVPEAWNLRVRLLLVIHRDSFAASMRRPVVLITAPWTPG